MKASIPSSTAVLIAKSIVFVAGDARYRALMPNDMIEFSKVFLQSVLNSWQINIIAILGRIALIRWLIRLLENCSVPGMIGHYILRKKRLEAIVTESLSRRNSLKQLVILGAGFDTLGIRMARTTPNLKVFEIDHPATSRAKKLALDRHNILQLKNFQMIAADLSEATLESTLESTQDFSFKEPTLLIAEGLFMYLEMAEVGKSLKILHKFSHSDTSFAFTYMLPAKDSGKPAFEGQSHWVDRWLGRKQEPFIWGASPENLDRFVQELELNVRTHTDAKALRDEFLTTPSTKTIKTAIGENIIWVDKRSGDLKQ